MIILVFAIYFSTIAFLIVNKKNIFLGLGVKFSKRKIISDKFAFPLVLSVFVVLVVIKIFHLSQSGSIIQNELIAPAVLSSSGESLLKKIVTESNSAEINRAYEKLNLSNSGLEFANNKLALENLRYFYNLESTNNLEKWILENKLLVAEASMWRGRVIHHYSTILFPLREVKEGNWGYLFTSQYGLVSLIPLLLVKKESFLFYGITSLYFLLIFGCFLLYRTRKNLSDNLIAGGILIALIVFTNLGAVRISPGFSFLRYFPIAILLYLLSRLISNKNERSNWLFLILAILNSLQFNILFLFIASTTYALIAIERKIFWMPNIFNSVFPVFTVSMLQIILLINQRSPFTPSLFSSVGESNFSVLYALSILIFPIANIGMERMKLPVGALSMRAGREQIIFASVVFGLCSSYAISFVKSPQHYVGFIAMSFIAMYILLKDSINSRAVLIVSIILLLFPAFHFKYFDLGKRPRENYSDLYSYRNEIGAPLYFRTALDISRISKAYALISEKYSSNGKIFFISKDKNFIELFNGKNIDPRVYDVFTNFIDLSPASAISKLKEGGAKYVVLDNQILLDYSLQAVSMSQAIVGNEEQANHIRIINNLQDLSRRLEKNVLECNSRYCIYQI